MKNWIRFACVALFFVLNYSVEVRLERNTGISEQLFLFTGQKVSYVICLLASVTAMIALVDARIVPNRRRWPTWAEIPKWPLVAFLLLFGTGSWSQDGYPGRDGYITVKHGWFHEANFLLYLSVVVTAILAELALQSSVERPHA